MVPHDALINALRSLKFEFKRQADRVDLYKQRGTTARVAVRRNQWHDETYAGHPPAGRHGRRGHRGVRRQRAHHQALAACAPPARFNAGRGKRGGARVLHPYLRHASTVWLLDIFGKREKADLSPADVKAIEDAVATIKRAESAR